MRTPMELDEAFMTEQQFHGDVLARMVQGAEEDAGFGTKYSMFTTGSSSVLPEIEEIPQGNAPGVSSRVPPARASGRVPAIKSRVGSRPLPLDIPLGGIDSGAGEDDEEDVAAQARMQDLLGVVGELRKEVRRKSGSGSDKVSQE